MREPADFRVVGLWPVRYSLVPALPALPGAVGRLRPVAFISTDAATASAAVWAPVQRGDRQPMGMITVQVWDATGSKRQDVELPDDAPMNRILAVLLERMSFPQFAPDGQPLSYKFHHRASGRQLLDDQSLADIGAQPGDVLRLQPEITAG